MVRGGEKDDAATARPRATPDTPTTDQTNVTVDVEMPEASKHEAVDVDEPEALEEPDGYGHGV
jgi:hypothetical protein